MADITGKASDFSRTGLDPSSLPGMQANPFEPSSSLPGVPRTGGGLSSTDQLMSTLQKNAGSSLATYMMAADARSRAVTAIVMKGLSGEKAQHYMNSDQGKLANLAISTMINHGLGGMMNTGGNILDLGFGVNSIAGGGLNMSFAGGGGGFFAGRGAMTEMVTKKLFDSVNRDFYGPTGAARLHKTHGMDRGEMGQIMTNLSQSGAFAGINIGEMSQDKDGKWDMNPSSEAYAKISKAASGTARTLRMLQDITGNKNITEVFKMASQLTGISHADIGAPEQMQAKIDQVKNTAGSMGLNSGAMLSNILSRGGGPMAQNAVLSAARLMHGNNGMSELRKQSQEAGYYLPELNENTMASISQMGASAAGVQEPDVGAAIFALGHNDKAKQNAPAIRAALKVLATAGAGGDWAAKRADAQSVLRQELASSIGPTSTAAYFNAAGGLQGVMQSANAGDRATYAQILGSIDQSQLAGQSLENLAARVNPDLSRNMKGGTTLGATRDMLQFIQARDQSAYMSAVTAGDVGTVGSMIDASTTANPEQKVDMRQRVITDGIQAYDGAKMGGAMREFNSFRMNDPFLAGQIGQETQADITRREYQARVNSMFDGEGAAAKGGLVENWLRGMAGGENQFSEVAIQSLLNKDDPKALSWKLDRDAKTGAITADIDDVNAKKMAEIPGLDALLDIADKSPEEKVAAIKAAGKTQDGAANIATFLQEAGYSTAVFAGGQAGAAPNDAVTKEQGELSAKQDEKLKEAFGGQEPEVALRDDKGEMLTRLASGKGTKAEQEGWDLMVASRPAAAKGMLDAQIAEKEKLAVGGKAGAGIFGLFKSKEDEAADEVAALKKGKQEKFGAEEPAAADMLGKVTLAIPDGFLFDLYKLRKS